MDDVTHLMDEHRFAQAGRILTDELPAVRASGDRGALLACLANLGICRFECNELTEARSAFEEALALSRIDRNQHAEASVLHELCMVVAKSGQLDQAIKMCKETLELWLKSGEDGGAPLHTLSVLYQEAGQYAEALEVLLLVQEGCESRYDLEGLGKCLNEMGLVRLELGDVPAAVRCMINSIELKHRTGNVRGIPITARNLDICLRQHPQVLADPTIQAELKRLKAILR